MNTIVSGSLRASIGGGHVPVTLRRLAARALAANALVSGGTIEADATCVRDCAVSWLALAMLLAAWNIEAHLDDPATTAAMASDSSRSVSGGFDWTQHKPTRWTSCLVHDSSSCGA